MNSIPFFEPRVILCLSRIKGEATVSAKKLLFDGAMVLRCEPEELVRRIERNPRGRRLVTTDEARKHQYMQEAVAIMYSILCGCPCFVVDNTKKEPLDVLGEIVTVFLAIGMPFEKVD